MKKTLFLLATLLVVSNCSFFHGGGSDSSEIKKRGKSGEYTEYYQTRYGFSAKFPSDWQVNLNPSQNSKELKRPYDVAISAISPREGSKDNYQEKISIVVVDRPAGTVVSTPSSNKGGWQPRIYNKDPATRSSSKSGSTTVSSSSPDASRLAESGVATINGRSVPWYVSKTYYKGGVSLRQMSYDIRFGDRVYKLGWAGDGKLLSAHRKILYRVVESFKFE